MTQAQIALLLAVLSSGCFEEHYGPTPPMPIVPTSLPEPPAGPPRPKQPLPTQVVAEEVPPEPSTPAGLERAKVGDLLEFNWTRAKTPSAAGKSGTLTLVRVEPAVPFTFRVELKSGKDFDQQHYQYGSEVALDRVLFHTDVDTPQKKMKAAGMIWDCVQSSGRLIASGAASLALSGGLVSQTAPPAVAVTLTRVGTTRATGGGREKIKVLDTLEPPIAVAIGQLPKLGADELQTQIAAAAQPCTSSLKRKKGRLEGVISAGKVLALRWDRKPAPKAFDKCVRQALKKLKLPTEQTPIDVAL